MRSQRVFLPGAVWLSRTQMLVGFGTALILLVAITLFSIQRTRREADSRTWVTTTVVVLKRTMTLEKTVAAMEADHRAFLVRGDRHFLASRDASLLQATREINALIAVKQLNAEQRKRLTAMAQLLNARVEQMRRTTNVALREGIDAARTLFKSEGQLSIGPLRDAVAELDQAEIGLLELHLQETAAQSQRLYWWMVLGSGFAVLLLGLSMSALLSQLRRSEVLASELTRANATARHALDLVDATHDGVFIYEASTLQLIYVNLGAVAQLGYSRAELLGMSILDVKRGFDEGKFRALLAPLQAGEVDVLAIETTHRRKDGSDVPVEVSIRYASIGDSQPSLVSIARDISARKQAEDDRQLFFDLSLDMLCISSVDGYFKQLSPAFTATLGWSVAELLSRPFLDFVHPDDHAATLAEVERQIGLGQSVMHFENRYLHKDGSWRVLSWKSAPQRDGRMYATARDVTESNLAEQRIIALNRELIERQTALESSNKELEAFSYSVSHDLRAPLRHIDGYARMLEEDAAGQLPADAQRYLQTIIASAHRMGRLIDDLLGLSRWGRKPLTPELIDMRALIERALGELDINNKDGTKPRIEIDAALPPACADPSLMLQVWINLLSNAVKYSAPRGDAASVVVVGTQHADHVSYSVRDNGVGFDMRYASKLFGVFQRMHPQDEFEGTGVGLAIVQRIINRHGGHISAFAEPDNGACFTFDLPITPEAA